MAGCLKLGRRPASVEPGRNDADGHDLVLCHWHQACIDEDALSLCLKLSMP